MKTNNEKGVLESLEIKDIPETYSPSLIVRCAAYNAANATDYTPESYDEARTRVPLMIAWDQGWEQSEIARKYEERYFAARDILSRIVTQYDAAPDGQLGKGFTNEPFLAARTFLSSPNA